MALTESQHPSRNPTWSRDELILALDLYVRSNGNPPRKSSAEIMALSSLLNKISGSHSKEDDHRNPNGVYMKLMNFRRFDPVYQAQGKTGLTRGNKLEEFVWNEFAIAPDRLSKTAKAIVANLDDKSAPFVADTAAGIEEAEEGRILTRAYLIRERSRKLVEAKKTAALRAMGRFDL